MKKDELVKLICAKVINTNQIDKKDLENSSFCGRDSKYKQGLYFLYNDSGDVIYIGMLSGTDETSLYDRMKGHGSGSHCRQSWYGDVSYGKFYHFDVSVNELKILERLAISGMGQPMYNDGHNLSQTCIDNLSSKI